MSKGFFTLYIAETAISGGSLPGSSGSNTTSSELQTIMGIVFSAVGSLALLVIVLSGFRYITAAGDPQKLSLAKNGIIYALVGMAAAIAADAIVSFIVGQLIL